MKKVYFILLALAILAIGCKKEKQATPPSLTTSAATAITAGGATVSGNITADGGMAVTKRGVVWAIHSTPTLSDSLTQNGSGTGSFTATLTALAANTQYYVRAYAINGAGTAYGNQISFTTAKGVPAVTTTIAGATDAGTGIAASGGNVISDGGASVTARGVVYSTSPHPTVNNSFTTDGTGTGLFTSSLGPLSASTTYYYRAYATNSYGTGYGVELTLATGNTATVTDIDGNVYQTITIGTQTWTLSNLKVKHYQNGDAITDLTNGIATRGFYSASTFNGYTYPNGDSTQVNTYGRYYSIYAIYDTRNIAPKGWHVSTDADWRTLEFYEGMTAADTTANNGVGEEGTIGGKFLMGGSSGLNIQLAGYYIDGAGFASLSTVGIYYTSSGLNSNSLFAYGFNLTGAPGPIYRAEVPGAFSVRCVKNP